MFFELYIAFKNHFSVSFNIAWYLIAGLIFFDEKVHPYQKKSPSSRTTPKILELIDNSNVVNFFSPT